MTSASAVSSDIRITNIITSSSVEISNEPTNLKDEELIIFGSKKFW
jgi:hypothetical protein